MYSFFIESIISSDEMSINEQRKLSKINIFINNIMLNNDKDNQKKKWNIYKNDN